MSVPCDTSAFSCLAPRCGKQTPLPARTTALEIAFCSQPPTGEDKGPMQSPQGVPSTFAQQAATLLGLKLRGDDVLKQGLQTHAGPRLPRILSLPLNVSDPSPRILESTVKRGRMEGSPQLRAPGLCVLGKARRPRFSLPRASPHS